MLSSFMSLWRGKRGTHCVNASMVLSILSPDPINQIDDAQQLEYTELATFKQSLVNFNFHFLPCWLTCPTQ